ncbi:MAG: nitroreductase family protein [Candidatus Thermoplasmatota archaeon]|nr:nitroreductase family protein [Candidatus Thermoplasmatota archaeon]MEC9076239.1 nitroreductase family protein [Candidatus Thermoplasmatota archaeon]
MGNSEEEDGFIPLDFEEFPEDEMIERARSFFNQMSRRRTTRHFSDREVPKEMIELAIKTASTAPSGANLQPWTFVAISDEELRTKIRVEAEKEEKRFYDERVPEEWEEVLAPLGTDHIKEHITDAPWVVVIFRHSKRERKGELAPTYYSQESCGIAAGLFITAVHNMGLSTLPHTPSPMGFLREILDRPAHEHPMLLLPVGFPAEGARVPDLLRKSLEQVSEFRD